MDNVDGDTAMRELTYGDLEALGGPITNTTTCGNVDKHPGGEARNGWSHAMQKELGSLDQRDVYGDSTWQHVNEQYWKTGKTS